MTHPPTPPGPREPDRGSDARSRTPAMRPPMIVAAGCAALVLLLLLTLGGVFTVRALTSDEETTQGPSVEDAEDGPGADADQGQGTPETGGDSDSEDASPPADAHPQGTPIEHQGESIDGTVEVTIGQVDWDATDWVQDQGQLADHPADQKYIMVEAELTYRGSEEFTPLAWASISYVGQDGTEYQEAGVATPSDAEQQASTDGQSRTQQWVFLVPEDLPEGGHFVIGDFGPLEEGQWIEAV